MNRFIGGALLLVAAFLWASNDTGVAPGPTPPTPVDPAPPIPAPGIHVLLLEESFDRAKLPLEQAAIFNSILISQWLADHNAKWLFTDDDEPLTGADQAVWLAAKNEWLKTDAGKKNQLPWLIISNGKTGYSGPPGNSPTEMIALLERYK